jgi:hypothetical protein
VCRSSNGPKNSEHFYPNRSVGLWLSIADFAWSDRPQISSGQAFRVESCNCDVHSSYIGYVRTVKFSEFIINMDSGIINHKSWSYPSEHDIPLQQLQMGSASNLNSEKLQSVRVSLSQVQLKKKVWCQLENKGRSTEKKYVNCSGSDVYHL